MKKHIPNTITCCNLICGCIATCAGFHGQYMTAFLFIILGAVFDFFDGFVARLLCVSGPMGVELDSLADVITFGLAPASMIFTLFTQVYYPEAIYSPTWFRIMPFTAFLMPAFAALRLAKFNIDDNQHDGFIGLPTPANAIFWSALISSSHKYLTSPMFNAPFLFAFMLVFCLLMVSNVPMFKLKFKDFKWTTIGNKRKIFFLAVAVVALIVAAVCGARSGHVVRYMSRTLCGLIGFYILLSVVAMYRDALKS